MTCAGCNETDSRELGVVIQYDDGRYHQPCYVKHWTAIHHADCVPVDPFTRHDVHHLHEGRRGFWLFESEVPEGYNRLRAMIAAELHRYPREARGPDAKNISAAIKDSRFGWRDIYRELEAMDAEHLVRGTAYGAKHWVLTDKGRRVT